MSPGKLKVEKGSLPSSLGKAFAGNWAAFFLLAMIGVFSLTGRNFFSIVNFQNILHLNTVPLLLAAAETFVIITGGMDISIGMVTGLSSVLAAWCMQALQRAALPEAAVILLGASFALVASLLPGLVNGIVITRLKVPPFIATMGMWGITCGLTLKICHGFPMQGLPGALPRLGNGYLLYIHPGKSFTLFHKPDYLADSAIRELLRLVPFSFVFVALVLLLLAFLLNKLRFGQHILAIGGNLDAAIRSGIAVDRHLVLVYTLSSFLAGIAGVFNVFQTGIGNYTTFGALYELFAVAAVVIGGASLMGGKGKIFGSAIGVLVIAFLENGLAISGVQPFYRYIAVGVLLVIAVIIDRLFPDLL